MLSSVDLQFIIYYAKRNGISNELANTVTFGIVYDKLKIDA